MNSGGKKSYWFVIVCFLFFPMQAQTPPSGLPLIELMAEAKKFSAAENMLRKDIQYFLSQNNTDTLVQYIFLSGKVKRELYGSAKAETAVFNLLDKENLKIPLPCR